MSLARWTPWAAAAACVVASAPAFAQEEWAPRNFDNDGFSVAAPADLAGKDAVFTAADGAKYPARVYTLVQGKQIYTVTVADFSTTSLEGDRALDYAVQGLAKQGAIAFDIPSRAGRAYGREVNLVRRDGSQSMLSLYYVQKHLFQAEGKSLPPEAEEGSSDAIRFVESIAFVAAPQGGGQGGQGGGGQGGAQGAGPAGGARAGGGQGGGQAAGGQGGGGQGGGAAAAPPAPAPPPIPPEPVSAVVKVPTGAFTEAWRWSATAAGGKVEYCRQATGALPKCVVADNPNRGDHVPASKTSPMISAVIPGQAWVAVGGVTYFCKRTSYTKGSTTEVTCEDAAKGRLPREQPTSVVAMSNNAGRFLFTGNRSYFCQNVPAPDDGPSQTFLSCVVL